MKCSFLFFLALLSLLSGCRGKPEAQKEEILSIQTIDRNGFTETISSKERLSHLSKIDFLTPQPYKKVLRVYPRSGEGKSCSRITSYHPNGEIYQYLEISEGRAHGAYKEWYPNGSLKIDAYVIEGLADVTSSAQMSWLFDGTSSIFDEEGRRLAECCYEKGVLEGDSIYFHPGGTPEKIIPYHLGEIDGTLITYGENQELLGESVFKGGIPHGTSRGKAANGSFSFMESYEEGKLLEGTYTSSFMENLPKVEKGDGFQVCFENNTIKSIIEIRKGKKEGAVRLFFPDGSLESLYHVKEGLKQGKELLFFPGSTTQNLLEIPKIAKLELSWQDDLLSGPVKTWYPNGILESEREMSRNKKHGISLAYYIDGSLMLMEEYEGDRLIRGSYYAKGDKKPLSHVEDGKGTATLHDSHGVFKQKVLYEGGKPKLPGEGP